MLVLSFSRVVNLGTGKAWRSSGNHIRTVLLENGKMDAKRSLVLLLAFYVEMLHYYFVFKRHAETQPHLRAPTGRVLP